MPVLSAGGRMLRNQDLGGARVLVERLAPALCLGTRQRLIDLAHGSSPQLIADSQRRSKVSVEALCFARIGEVADQHPIRRLPLGQVDRGYVDLPAELRDRREKLMDGLSLVVPAIHAVEAVLCLT